MRGRFITFEGIDGTGKTTQLQLLAAKMREEGYDVVVTKEPGSPVDPTTLGAELRQILFHTVTTHNMAPGVADCLFLADHIQHVGKVVEPALAEGRTVISDRYSDSQFAYAGAKHCPQFILDAYTSAFGPVPDITLLFVSSNPEVTLARANARRGQTHQSGKTWNLVQEQINIQGEYLRNLVGKTRVTVITVQPEQTPAQLFEVVWETIHGLLSQPVEYVEGENFKVITIPGAPEQLD